MSIAITEDHRALADTASDFLAQARRPRRGPRPARGARREPCRRSGRTLVELGWLGLHLPEEHGGSGYGIEELVVVVEELGRAVAPGSVRADGHRQRGARRGRRRRRQGARSCPGWPTAPSTGARRPRRRASTVTDGTASGPAGDGARRRAGRRCCWSPPATTSVVVEVGDGVTVETPPQPRPHPPHGPGHARRRAGHRAPRRARRLLVDLGPGDPVGRGRGRRPRVHRAWPPPTPRSASSSAVRSPCTRRSSTTAPTWPSPPSWPPRAVWDAARAAATGGDQLTYAAAVAATLAGAGRRPVRQPQHPGARRHRHHLGARRPPLHAPGHHAAAAPAAPTRPRADLTDLTRRGRGAGQGRRAAARGRGDPRRGPRLRRAASRASSADEQRTKLIETGYVMPHWPKPYGREAGADRAAGDRAGVRRGRRSSARSTASPAGTSSRSSSTPPTTRSHRWVPPALDQEVIWCQLFSEPDAGSDAAGIKTKATRVDGGWLVNGQKVWTSGAHVAGHGLRHRAHQPRRPQARGHHDDGHRHARRGRRGAPAAR